MSGVSSRARRVEAVKAAEKNAYTPNSIDISHFDERQLRIYHKYLEQWQIKIQHLDMEMCDLFEAYGFPLPQKKIK